MNIVKIMRKREALLQDQSKKIDDELVKVRKALSIFDGIRTRQVQVKKQRTTWSPERRKRFMATIQKNAAKRKS